MSTSGKFFKAKYGVAPAITTIKGRTRSEIRATPDVLDATDSDSAPYQNTDIGTQGMEITLEGHARANDYLPALADGLQLTDLKIFPTGDPGTFWHFPLAIIVGNVTTIEIRGKMLYTFTVRSRGTYTLPSAQQLQQ